MEKPNTDPESGDNMPRPTYAPVAMAMSVTMLAWGILTHWTVSLVGALLFVWALWSWMGEICRQWGKES